MTITDIALIVVLLALAWTCVELALTIRRARSSLDGLAKNMNSTLEELQPTLNQLDDTVKNLNNTMENIDPLLEKTGTAVDSLSLDLLRVDQILSDVSQVTGVAASASKAVSNTTSATIANAAAVVNRVRSAITETQSKGDTDANVAHIEAPAEDREAATPENDVPTVASDEGYFQYPKD